MSIPASLDSCHAQIITSAISLHQSSFVVRPWASRPNSVSNSPISPIHTDVCFSVPHVFVALFDRAIDSAVGAPTFNE